MTRGVSTDTNDTENKTRTDNTTKPRMQIVKTKEKPSIQSLIIDKSSFKIGFIIGSFLLSMFIIGCIVGSTVM